MDWIQFIETFKIEFRYRNSHLVIAGIPKETGQKLILKPILANKLYIKSCIVCSVCCLKNIKHVEKKTYLYCNALGLTVFCKVTLIFLCVF